MAIGTIETDSYVSQISSTIIAEALVGGNGTGDPPEFDITDQNGNGVGGNVCWDANLTDGFDSGWVPAQLDLEPNGSNVNWTITVGGPQPLNYSGISYGTIVAVMIRAAVQTSASSAWRQISVHFYQAGTLTDSYSLRAGPQINLNGEALPVAGEQVLTVTPNSTTNDKVVVSGQFRFASASTTPPDPEDMFAQICVATQ